MWEKTCTGWKKIKWKFEEASWHNQRKTLKMEKHSWRSEGKAEGNGKRAQHETKRGHEGGRRVVYQNCPAKT